MLGPIRSTGGGEAAILACIVAYMFGPIALIPVAILAVIFLVLMYKNNK